jgi:hypothetical protein
MSTNKIDENKKINNNNGVMIVPQEFGRNHQEYTISGSWEADKKISKRNIFKPHPDQPIKN